MSNFYLSRNEIEAVRAIDLRMLEERLQQALDECRHIPLYDLHLSIMPHIAAKLSAYDRDVSDYVGSKTAQKRERTYRATYSSGSALASAIRWLQERADTEEAEGQLFRIEEPLATILRSANRVEARISYRWRSTAADKWTTGAITFVHNVDMRPDPLDHQPKRKPSAAAREQARETELYRQWDQLRFQAMHSVLEFFRKGGKPVTIPALFEAKPSVGSRYLNNFSCNFWSPSDLPEPGSAVPTVTIPETDTDLATLDGRFRLNDRVEHPKFGLGTIVHIEGYRVCADYGEMGHKITLASFLKPFDA